MMVRIDGVLNHIGMIAKTEDGVNRQVSQRPHVAQIFNPLAAGVGPIPTGGTGYEVLGGSKGNGRCAQALHFIGLSLRRP